MPWNRWPHHRGIRGHMFMESMATCAWNTQLTREIVDDLAPRLGKELLHLKVEQPFEQKFRSTIQSIAGLFRWRLRESRAVLAEEAPVAQELRDTLLAVGKMLRERPFAHVPALAKKQDIVLKLIEYLDRGGDPDILRQI